MYNSIQAHYDNDDIWERKQEYYHQVLNPSGKRLSPHKTIRLETIPQPGTFISNQSNVSQANSSRVHNPQYVPINDRALNPNSIPAINISQINSRLNLQKPSHSSVSQSLKQTDPQRYKALEQRAQLYRKLQLVTVGLPLKEQTQETELLSNNYIMPHYKSQKINELKQQERNIKKLTAQMLQNQKIISRISTTKEALVNRIERIRKIDKEIYSQLDEDKNQQIQNYLRIANNLLAQGQSEDKIAAILKKILY